MGWSKKQYLKRYISQVQNNLNRAAHKCTEISKMTVEHHPEMSDFWDYKLYQIRQIQDEINNFIEVSQ